MCDRSSCNHGRARAGATSPPDKSSHEILPGLVPILNRQGLRLPLPLRNFSIRNGLPTHQVIPTINQDSPSGMDFLRGVIGCPDECIQDSRPIASC
jgi:hypothetical protein